MRSAAILILAMVLAGFHPETVFAQNTGQNTRISPSTCLAVADNQQTGPRIINASYQPPARSAAQLAALENGEVLITYVGHSAFRIETAQGVVAVTDYNGFSGEGALPDIVTMNHAHSTHYTDSPNPLISHVLRGWNPDGDDPASHHLELRDMLVRNVTTDIYYEGSLIEKDGNSIFIFETAGLCIGHLGHLHHKLTPEHIARIGRIDVLFMPVDGTYTMSQAGMIELAGQLRSSIVIPMHYFSTFSLQRFIAGMQDKFALQVEPGTSTRVSLADLPSSPQVRVLSAY
ncbi:MAG: MBL fold metallo-hydrolase [Nitratireductor sp.]|nr:MBL fold metallo-hydrolase [Nitratireductor sp.]